MFSFSTVENVRLRDMIRPALYEALAQNSKGSLPSDFTKVMTCVKRKFDELLEDEFKLVKTVQDPTQQLKDMVGVLGVQKGIHLFNNIHHESDLTAVTTIPNPGGRVSKAVSEQLLAQRDRLSLSFDASDYLAGRVQVAVVHKKPKTTNEAIAFINTYGEMHKDDREKLKGSCKQAMRFLDKTFGTEEEECDCSDCATLSD